MKTQNIISYLTGAKKIILSSLSIITLCFLNILFCSVNNSSALTYSSDVEVGFTFDPTISINLSGDLLINNLAPGSTADSNIVSLTVATNSQYGYTLLATAGTSSTNTNLTNTANSSYKFTSISTSADLSSLTTNNTWGFSYSTNNGTNWSNYTGLPKDNNDEGATGKQLARTTSLSDNLPIRVKIGAKAGSDQAAGVYTNVINFYAVANPSFGRNYTVDYVDTSGIVEENMPETQTGITYNNQITLSDEWPYDSEGLHEFSMWCTIDNDSNWCYGEEYYPGDTIIVADGAGDIEITLYALWEDEGYDDSVNLFVDNSSEADVYVNGYYVPANSTRTEGIRMDDYASISITPPASCTGAWHWEAGIDGDGMFYYESGTDDGSFGINMGSDYNVTITGYCNQGGGG